MSQYQNLVVPVILLVAVISAVLKFAEWAGVFSPRQASKAEKFVRYTQAGKSVHLRHKSGRVVRLSGVVRNSRYVAGIDPK